MPKPTCQTCGARAEWVEGYQAEIADLKRQLAQEIRRRENAERKLHPEAIATVRIPIREDVAPPVVIPIAEGPRILERWTVEEEVRKCRALPTAVAVAFRDALK